MSDIIPLPETVLTAHPTAIKLYAVIAKHQRRGLTPTRKELATGVGINLSNLDRHIKGLEQGGHMTVIRGGGRTINTYQLGGR